MRPVIRRGVGVALAAAVTLGIGALSQLPYEPAGPRQSLLRLSWRARGERVEACRRLSREEIAALPIHMRRTEVCEGRVLPYHLSVELDGRTVLRDTVRAAGAREDRPLYVFAELPVAPGTHRLVVRFLREAVPPHPDDDDDDDDDDGGDDGERDDDREEDENERVESAGATPARLELVQTVSILPGEVALVTYDSDLRTLVTRTPQR